MIKIIKLSLMLPIHLLRRYKARTAIVQLRLHEHSRMKAVGDALHELLTNTLSVEEREMIAQIEQRRSFLLSSNRTIDVIDYGAGSSSSNRKHT